MERLAVTPPLKCFGSEQSLDNPLCPECKHRQECASLLGHLANRASLSAATYRFLPEGLLHFQNADVYGDDPDLASLEEVYAFCHSWVFDHRPPGRIGRNRRLILQRIREAETSVKLFCLSNMLGWKQSHLGEPFHSKVLTGEASVHQVKTFASACRSLYGTFDTTALDQLVGSDVAHKDFEALLLQSEITAGSWIVGYKMFRSGQISRKLYAEKETLLHPYWLAIEPTYYADVLGSYIREKDANISPLIHKHRWNVCHILGQIKRHPRQAVTLFRTRERIMPEAVRRVLYQRGYHPDNFMAERLAVTDSIIFWARLAVALQQIELLKLLDGTPSAFDTNGLDSV